MVFASVELPIPPSANHLWIVARGRLIQSRQYKSWLSVAIPLCRVGLPYFANPVEIAVMIQGGKGWRSNRDLDNCLKPIIDAIKHASRIKDDSCHYVTGASVRYMPPVRGVLATATVSITSA